MASRVTTSTATTATTVYLGWVRRGRQEGQQAGRRAGHGRREGGGEAKPRWRVRRRLVAGELRGSLQQAQHTRGGQEGGGGKDDVSILIRQGQANRGRSSRSSTRTLMKDKEVLLPRFLTATSSYRCPAVHAARMVGRERRGGGSAGEGGQHEEMAWLQPAQGRQQQQRGYVSVGARL